MSKDAYYFPHDSNARYDEKSQYIIYKYGMQGYGLYWMFVECMHEQPDGKLTCALIDGLSINFGVDITLLKQFYNDAITIELFVTDGIKYWSERVLRNKEKLDEKRRLKSEAGKRGMQSRWGFDNTVITKHNKRKESKVNKSKVKESINNTFDELISSYTQDANLIIAINNFIDHRQSIKKPIKTENTLKLLFKELDKHPDKIGVLEQSILNGWQGIFELKNQRKESGGNVFDEIGKERGYW